MSAIGFLGSSVLESLLSRTTQNGAQKFKQGFQQLGQDLQSGNGSHAEAPTQIQDTIETHDPDQTEIALARKLLREDSDASNPPKAVQLLWQAVEKGSAPAEIELAGLYLAGRGVSKSCSQALVLLTAAQNHKSALAEQRLRSLPRYGCDPTRDPTTPASSEPPGAASTTQ